MQDVSTQLCLAQEFRISVPPLHMYEAKPKVQTYSYIHTYICSHIHYCYLTDSLGTLLCGDIVHSFVSAAVQLCCAVVWGLALGAGLPALCSLHCVAVKYSVLYGAGSVLYGAGVLGVCCTVLAYWECVVQCWCTGSVLYSAGVQGVCCTVLAYRECVVQCWRTGSVLMLTDIEAHPTVIWCTLLVV